jgi:hypothetical protein
MFEGKLTQSDSQASRGTSGPQRQRGDSLQNSAKPHGDGQPQRPSRVHGFSVAAHLPTTHLQRLPPCRRHFLLLLHGWPEQALASTAAAEEVSPGTTYTAPAAAAARFNSFPRSIRSCPVTRSKAYVHMRATTS